MRHVLLALALLGIAGGAVADDLSGGAFICHNTSSLGYTTWVGEFSGEAPLSWWCEQYPPISTCEDQVTEIWSEVGEEYTFYDNFYVLVAWSEAKTFCAAEFGLGDYDNGLLSFSQHGACGIDPATIPTTDPPWPAPNSGIAIAWAADNAPSGNFVPVYFFGCYLYGSYYGSTTVPLTEDPAQAFIGTASCDVPPATYPAYDWGTLGLNTSGDPACYEEQEPEEACCFDLDCVLLTEADCLAQEGEWVGGPCDPNPCIPVEGACCVIGNCTVETEADCAQLGGVWHGDIASCDPNPCQAVCCYVDENHRTQYDCIEVTTDECEQLDGLWSPNWPSCDPNPCPELTGACCSIGTCAITTDTDCADFGGIYQGDFTTCSPNPCPAVCCYVEEGRGQYDCVVGLQGICEDELGGSFYSDLGTCDPNPCPEILGACCDAGACLVLTETECGELGFAYQGDFSTCDPNPCPAVCCFEGDGRGQMNCLVTTEMNCLEGLNGEFYIEDTTCDPNPCPQLSGACCVVGICQVVTEPECQGLGGNYQGDYTDCEPNPCPAVCCYQPAVPGQEDCIIALEDECTVQFGGQFYSGLNSCDPNPCPQLTGACCFEAVCEALTEPECLDGGGVYMGDHTLCEPHPCKAVCCYEDAPGRGQMLCSIEWPGTCEEDLSGTWYVDWRTCDPNPCPQLTGACCMAGNCMVMTEPECEAAEGIYQGDYTDCDPNPCPAVCCYESRGQMECSVVTMMECYEGLQGEWYWDMTSCDPNPCPELYGACCVGVYCYVMTEPECGDAGGEFQGDYTTCDPDPCPKVCCYEDRGQWNCEILDPGACTEMGGTVYYDEFTCDPNPCPQIEGACCTFGFCEILTAPDCEAQGGTYQGDYTTCDPNPCEAVCCYEAPDRSQMDCLVTLEANCLELDGLWNPQIVSCDPNPCPELRGACCDAGACTVVSEPACSEAGGVYQGDHTTCDPNPCPAACCYIDGARGQMDCLVTTQDDCEINLQGTFYVGTETCDPNPCPELYGACCVIGDCTVSTEPECGDAGGVYQGDFTTCEPNPCAAVCCYDAGPDRGQLDCTVVTNDACDELQGTWYSGEGSCDPNPCPQLTGACCNIGYCTVMTEPECMESEGVYQGDDTTCDPNPCAAVCCYENGDRSQMLCDVITEGSCNELSGMWYAEEGSCDPNPCPELVGACCLIGVCEVMEEPACNEAGGVYQGDHTTCEPNPCEAVCCYEAPDRGQMLCEVGLQLYCEEDLGGTFYPNDATCDPNPCPELYGACCEIGYCSVTTEPDCQEAGGVYMGDYSTCEPNPCDAVCCYEGDTEGQMECMVVVWIYCKSVGGMWMPDLGSCEPNPCPQLEGACCLVGVCEVMEEPACGEAGGVYQGDYTTCDPNPCEAVCCYEPPVPGQMACVVTLEDDCAEGYGGTFYPAWASCDPNPCPELYGACCVAGYCTVLTEPECETAGGVYLGDYTTCEPNPCPAACCYTDDIRGQMDCMVATAAECMEVDGMWMQDEASCDPNPCPELYGACCVIGVCTVTTEPDCEDSGGVYQGDGTTCDPNPCDAVCCYEGDIRGQMDCAISTMATCEDLQGTWYPDLGSCEPNPCPELEGACCVGSNCIVVTEPECEQSEGIYQGDYTTCDPNPCPAACCVGHQCYVLTEAECQEQGGIWYPETLTCAQKHCTVACCFVDGSCADMTYLECEAAHGYFRTEWWTCDVAECPIMIGACCYGVDRMTCQILTKSACEAVNGTWYPGETEPSSEICASPVPTQETTWSKIKNLYR